MKKVRYSRLTARRDVRFALLGIASAALVACGGSPSQTGAGGGSGGGKGVASSWTLSGKPQEDIQSKSRTCSVAWYACALLHVLLCCAACVVCHGQPATELQ